MFVCRMRRMNFVIIFYATFFSTRIVHFFRSLKHHYHHAQTSSHGGGTHSLFTRHVFDLRAQGLEPSWPWQVPSVGLVTVLGNRIAFLLVPPPVCQFVSEGATRPSSVPCFLSTKTASGEGKSTFVVYQ